MQEFIRDFWTAIAGIIAALGWLFRLESRVAANTKEIERMAHQRHEDMKAAQKSRDETTEILREVQRDIKAILQRGGQ